MSSKYSQVIGVTLADDGPFTFYKNETGKVGERPDGVDLRVPVRFGDYGVWFYSEQGAQLSEFRVGQLASHMFPDTGTCCLLARSHAPGQLKFVTTRNGELSDLVANAALNSLNDACVDPAIGLYMAGSRDEVPTVALLDMRGKQLGGGWTIGAIGESADWGAIGGGWVGYLVGDKFMIKAPGAKTFEQLNGVAPASKVFWVNGDGGGAFVLRRNDGVIEFLHPGTCDSLAITKLDEGEDLLRVDLTERIGRVDLVITTGPASYRIFHI